MSLRGIARACSMALLATVVLVSDALAHTRLVRSSPARGDSLLVAPALLRLEFNEAPELSMSRVRLLDSLKREIRLAPLRIAGDSTRVLIARLAGHLSPGRYTVTWQVAGQDGHPVHGEFTFVVTAAAAGRNTSATGPQPITVTDPTAPRGQGIPTETHRDEGFDSESLSYVLIRWVQFVGLLLVIGAVTFRLLVVDRATRDMMTEGLATDATRRTLRLAVSGTVLLAVSAVARLVAQWTALRIDAVAPSAVPLGRVLRESTWGHAWVAEVIAIVVLVAALALAWRRGRDGAAWALAALSAIALAFVPALSGHAAVPRTAAPVVLDALHVLAAGGWMGTLLVMLIAGMPSARRLPQPGRAPAMAAFVGAFSPVALSCAGLIVATGVLASLRNVGSLDALAHSRYGNMLLRKLFFLAMAVIIGFYNWRRAQPALASGNDGRIRRAMQAEVAAGAIILLLTAYLVAIPTPVQLIRP